MVMIILILVLFRTQTYYAGDFRIVVFGKSFDHYFVDVVLETIENISFPDTLSLWMNIP